VLAPRTEASGRVVINGKGHASNLDVITAKYPLEDINQELQDMKEGKNVRGTWSTRTPTVERPG